jgi:hypothetical protein
VNELTGYAHSGSGCRIIELPKILDARRDYGEFVRERERGR